ncbi:MAG: radical SAM protein [Bacilli bacterium]|nr:radical SAM protein [Bacilli bacterium]
MNYSNLLKECHLCPRNCGINRYQKKGFCGAGNRIKLAHYQLHMWEEPIISGKKGSGTIFFSHCNLHCLYCQNKKISIDGYGKEISNKRLAEIMLELQSKGANNINLVTPTHYIPQIATVLRKIKNKDLHIPIVYNTSSYETVGALIVMKDLVDIYLADLKYFDDTLAEKYSKCKNYFETATMAIDEMYRQVGQIKINKKGLLEKGLIVRVLILPEHTEDAKNIIRYLYQTYKNDIFISIMNQYTPTEKYPYKNLNRKITEEEYNEVIQYALSLGIENAFIQEGDTAEESFIPNFNKDLI